MNHESGNEAVRDSPEKVAEALDELATAHARDGHRHYYRVRDRQFNPLREGLRIAYTPDLAAMLIYLNRTGFNGLFRVNARGEFNVPAGRYDRPTIVDRPKLIRVAHALAGKRGRLECRSFEIARTLAEAGDFLYVDPPHAPLSVTSSFTSYTAPRFAAADQRRLHAMIVELARRGCHVLLSNSTADGIAALYDADGGVRDAGLRALRVPARRAVNSNSTRRGHVEEYLITNIAGS